MAVVASSASSAARWARICSANVLEPTSTAEDTDVPKISSNSDVLSVIVMSGVSVVSIDSDVSVISDVSVPSDVVVWAFVRIAMVGMRDAADVLRWFRAVTAAELASDMQKKPQIAVIKDADMIFSVFFMTVYPNVLVNR